MIVPSDEEYIATKNFMLGKSVMKAEFNELATFIEQKFGVKAINIIYDTIDNGQQPRLQICFELESELQSFHEINGFNYDDVKETMVANAFKRIVREKQVGSRQRIFQFFSKSSTKTVQYKLENLFVCFSAFEPVAKMEANQRISEYHLDLLIKSLSNPNIWQISRCFSSTTFFVYTDEQVKYCKNSDIEKNWTESYF